MPGQVSDSCPGSCERARDRCWIVESHELGRAAHWDCFCLIHNLLESCAGIHGVERLLWKSASTIPVNESSCGVSHSPVVSRVSSTPKQVSPGACSVRPLVIAFAHASRSGG